MCLIRSIGISIGSIASDKTVSGVTISGNTVVDSMYGFRIKVDASVLSLSFVGEMAYRYTYNTVATPQTLRCPMSLTLGTIFAPRIVLEGTH